ncbi:hypothetical protein KUCAC02_034712 [Chaenocephalus aceratus]|nr:hypothetical protein KUCAC02_034712 [Chaenocephalus aceratus]
MAGALEKEGCSLSQIVSKVTELLKGIGTLGVSLSPCSVPGSLPSFDLPPGDMEIGLGIKVEKLQSKSLVRSCKNKGRWGESVSMQCPGSLPSFDLPPGDMEIGLGSTVSLESRDRR